MSRDLVHFVASDAHDTRHRPPTLGDASAALAAEWGEEAARPLFVDNPQAVIAGNPLDIERRPIRKKRRRWYQFWS